uniref:Type 2 DNA topoisomerase 6 subunit B-like n=1 Tax=Oryza nivara TaxID=4536 RepID=A0A0E0HV69_ORYNI
MASSPPPSTASPTSSSPYRKLLHSLIYWAVQRCRMSESPCRLTVSVKRSPEPAGSSPLRISVSDTGVGSKLEEFLELDALARETPVEKWDGTLLITTTGIDDKAIYRYQFNLQEDTSSSTRFTKLATIGTEVCLCLPTEADVDDLILWLVGFVRKIFVLRASNLACELFVAQTDSAGSGDVCLSQDSDDVHISITTSSIDRLVSGLKDYALSHANTSDRCEACYMNRVHTMSNLTILPQCADEHRLAKLRHLLRKALKSALFGLKADHAEDFLSCHGQKVREYVPDLAESIAGLILSSNDQEFQDECIALLGLGSDQDLTEGAVRSCIGEKMNRIIEMNDTKENVEHNAPYLFECERFDEDYSLLDEDDPDEDMIFDF